MTSHSRESQVLAKVAEDYRRRGYDVDVEPRGTRLPEFLGGFQPDLIARSPADSVVVEVKVGTRTSVAERFREVAAKGQPSARVAILPRVRKPRPARRNLRSPAAAPLSVLQERAQNGDTLVQAGQSEAAFLLFFSALEGILRVLGQRAQLPLESCRPRPLIRELYSAGEIDRVQFESLMRFLPIRNQLVHGFRPQESLDVEQLRLLVQALLAEVGSDESQQPA